MRAPAATPERRLPAARGPADATVEDLLGHPVRPALVHRLAGQVVTKALAAARATRSRSCAVREDQDDHLAERTAPCIRPALPVPSLANRRPFKQHRGTTDVVVVNIGDTILSMLFPILAAAPCLGIFHDFYIYNLSGWLHPHANGLDYRRHDAEIIAINLRPSQPRHTRRPCARADAGHGRSPPGICR
ncbi:hypothetical protein ACRAWD_03365 [Caulobacter segnis]